MTESYHKGEEYTNFWDYALNDSPFSEEDVAEFRAFVSENHDSMPLDNVRPPEPAVFVADIDEDTLF